MRVLVVHNEYRQHGGEEQVVQQETALLKEHGHEVHQFTVSNQDLAERGLSALRLAAQTVWSREAYRSVRDRIRSVRPDLIHVHNTFPRLSPSVYWVAQAEHVPVVQTLHNYRLLCVNGLLLREGRPCELCVGRTALPGMRNACYRQSRAASAVVASMQAFHRWMGTFRTKVDAYIVLTEFAKGLFLRAGLPAQRVFVKPNFVPTVSGTPSRATARDRTLVFVGRLAKEKGLDLLLAAWRRVIPDGWKLVIVGDGPDRDDLLGSRNGEASGIHWRGWLEREAVLQILQKARFLVVASKSYETFSLVIAESFSVGTPVIAPKAGVFPELVGTTARGFLYRQNDMASLSDALRRAMSLESDVWQGMSEAALKEQREKYSERVNYRRLMTIYDTVLERRSR